VGRGVVSAAGAIRVSVKKGGTDGGKKCPKLKRCHTGVSWALTPTFKKIFISGGSFLLLEKILPKPY